MLDSPPTSKTLNFVRSIILGKGKTGTSLKFMFQKFKRKMDYTPQNTKLYNKSFNNN